MEPTEVRYALDTEVHIYGKKGDPCANCKQVTAKHVTWPTDTDILWVCDFCEVSLAAGKE